MCFSKGNRSLRIWHREVKLLRHYIYILTSHAEVSLSSFKQCSLMCDCSQHFPLALDAQRLSAGKLEIPAAYHFSHLRHMAHQQLRHRPDTCLPWPLRLAALLAHYSWRIGPPVGLGCMSPWPGHLLDMKVTHSYSSSQYLALPNLVGRAYNFNHTRKHACLPQDPLCSTVILLWPSDHNDRQDTVWI